MMDLNTTWFLLIGVLLTGYAVLDGFDLGVGVLHLFATDERQRRINLAAIGPVWDGNEVWLLTAGGAMFAAFPPVYATVFSGFYTAFMLLLFALIFRAVSIEFRGQVDGPRWRRFWDRTFGLGSLAPAVLFGVAIGNVLRGLPIGADGSLHVSFFALLNPYSLLIGLLSLAMFVMHGAVYLAARTDGELQKRMARWATGAWAGFLILYVVATVATVFVSPFLFEPIPHNLLAWGLCLLLLGAVVSIPVMVRAGRFVLAFLASAATIGSMIGLMGVSLYPRMVPSSIDPVNSLNIYDDSSTQRTLTVMLVVALVGMPLVIGYTAYVYKVFMGKIVIPKDGY